MRRSKTTQQTHAITTTNADETTVAEETRKSQDQATVLFRTSNEMKRVFEDAARRSGKSLSRWVHDSARQAIEMEMSANFFKLCINNLNDFSDNVDIYTEEMKSKVIQTAVIGFQIVRGDMATSSIAKIDIANEYLIKGQPASTFSLSDLKKMGVNIADVTVQSPHATVGMNVVRNLCDK